MQFDGHTMHCRMLNFTALLYILKRSNLISTCLFIIYFVYSNKEIKFAEICVLRLDFDTFTLVGPSGTTLQAGGICTLDSFSVTGSSAVTALVPKICGENSGHHSKCFLQVRLQVKE